MPGSPGDRFVRMRSDGESLISGAARRLSRFKMQFKTPTLLDRSAPYFSGVKRFGISKFQHYWQDPFHTLLNLPWGRFILIFFATYMIEFLVFALIFWVQSDSCIEGKNGKFSHALWMSSRTASTLGFNQIVPNPECTFTNLMVMCQVIASSLVNFIMLGLVFARFSAPFKRASTIRFSGVMVCYQQPSSSYWCLSLRVANIRKHQLLKPTLRMVLTAVDSITPSNYLFEHLDIDGRSTQETNLELGFPANVTHIITPSSPLYNLSLLEMDTRMMEVLVFVDGIDAMTSKNMSARHAYNTNEVHLNEVFQPLHLEMRGGSLGLDFSGFDLTMLASVELLNEYNCDPGLAERPLPEVQSHMWHLRHMTFKRLTDHGNRSPGSRDRESEATTGGGPVPGPASLTRGSATYHPPIRIDGAPSSAAAAAAATVGASSNPFLSSAVGGGVGSSSWMGFGVTLFPGSSSSSGAAAAAAPLPPLPSGQQQPAPLPLSAFINSGQSGLESFADMTPGQHGHAHQPHQPPGFRGSSQLHHHHHHNYYQPTPQQQQMSDQLPRSTSPTPPPLQQQAATSRVHWSLGQQHYQLGGAGAGSGGSSNGLEMLPTSSPAMEPRVNGVGGGGGAGR